jgi:type II secretory pathway pseudopilin PulG
MNIGVVTVIFLLLAVLVAVGVLAAVALPHLRGESERDRSEHAVQTRHRSRTGS